MNIQQSYEVQTKIGLAKDSEESYSYGEDENHDDRKWLLS